MGRRRERLDRRYRAARRDDVRGPQGRRAPRVARGRATRACGVQAGDRVMGLDLIFGPSIERGPRRRRGYFTFDDGPDERGADAVLGTLPPGRVAAAVFLG